MKDFVSRLCCFLAATTLAILPCLSAPPHLSVVARKNAGGGGGSVFFVETFNASGYDNTPSATAGTPDPDYATAPAPLVGSGASLYLATSTDSVTWTFSSTGTIYGRGVVHPIGGQFDRQFLYLQDSSGNPIAYIRPRASSSWTIAQGTISTSTAVGWAADTTIYWWFAYTPGTGADGVLEVTAGTSTSKASNVTFSVTTGNATANAGRIYLNGDETYGMIIDQIEISTEAIGDF